MKLLEISSGLGNIGSLVVPIGLLRSAPTILTCVCLCSPERGYRIQLQWVLPSLPPSQTYPSSSLPQPSSITPHLPPTPKCLPAYWQGHLLPGVLLQHLLVAEAQHQLVLVAPQAPNVSCQQEGALWHFCYTQHWLCECTANVGELRIEFLLSKNANWVFLGKSLFLIHSCFEEKISQW